MEGRAAEAARELFRRRADLVRHARGSLEQHLAGTHDVLRRWGQPERVRLAGLFHSAYSTEVFAVRVFGARERPRVRELVGEDAERLVFAFSACRREALVAAASAPPDGEPVQLPTRWRGVTVRLSRRDLAELLVIHAANLAEQTCRPRGGPARWIADVSRFLAAARGGAEVVPPVLHGGDRVMTPEEESMLLRGYRAMLPKGAGARGAIRRDVLELSPVGEPLVVAGLWALAARRGRDAASLGERALALLDAWSTAWDKRLALPRWQELARLLTRDGSARDRELEAAGARALSALDVARGSPERIWAQLDALGALREAPRPPAPAPAAPAKEEARPDDGGLPPRFARYIAGLRTNAERPMLQFYPGLRATPFHDARAFPIVADLERLSAEIAAEARALDPDHFQDEAEDIGRTGKWGVAFLLEMGRRNEQNLARCPATRWIVDHHRTLTTHAGLMYFSTLGPGARVTPHHGPTNVRLRCHLGLEVPDGCGMQVGGIRGGWEEGRCVVFDDSFLHEVYNDGDRRRVVLVLDLWHPDLDDDEIALLAGLHRYGADNAATAARYWARNDAAAERARAEAARPPDAARALGEKIDLAMRRGDFPTAAEHAARHAELCRGTRWYPVARADDPEIPASVPWAPVLTPGKLVHDIEQIEYLERRGVVGPDVAALAGAYDDVLDTLRPLGPDARVPLVGPARAKIGHAYGRLVHVRPTPRVPRALSPAWDGAAVEAEYLGRKPNVVVVDGFLSGDALESLRLFCLESTVWANNRYAHGRLGAFFREGFNCPLLTQIAEELKTTLPRVVGKRRVTQVWGYKYATRQPELPPHADFAAVNVNFWITPDDANLDPDTGGLLLYEVDAPRDWDFESYNRNAGKIRSLLAERNARPTHVPYRCNRAIIFDSDLFHSTPAVTFKSGYENRRVNVTVLFGDRHDR
jgi:hypothetical protein